MLPVAYGGAREEVTGSDEVKIIATHKISRGFCGAAFSIIRDLDDTEHACNINTAKTATPHGIKYG